MNEESALLNDLIGVLSEEDLIRLSYRLRKNGKYTAATMLDSLLSQELTLLSELLNVLSEEELIRVNHRLSKNGKQRAAGTLDSLRFMRERLSRQPVL